MKTVYFVRHGQSKNCVSEIRLRQEASSLTSEGVEQVKKLSKKLKSSDIVFDKLISSNYLRAVQTAEILSDELGLTFSVVEDLKERQRHSFAFGLSKKGSSVLQAHQEYIDNFGKEGYRHSDEENYNDLNQRAGRAVQMLENIEEDNIICVTHGAFLRVLLAKFLFGDELNPINCQKILNSFRCKHTGIVELRKDPKYGWFLWRWNDYSHLS